MLLSRGFHSLWISEAGDGGWVKPSAVFAFTDTFSPCPARDGGRWSGPCRRLPARLRCWCPGKEGSPPTSPSLGAPLSPPGVLRRGGMRLQQRHSCRWGHPVQWVCPSRPRGLRAPGWQRCSPPPRGGAGVHLRGTGLTPGSSGGAGERRAAINNPAQQREKKCNSIMEAAPGEQFRE